VSCAFTFILPLVYVFSVHESNTNNNSLKDEERLQRNPTPQSFQASQLEQGNEEKLVD
jgi:hypothetical protein